MRTPSPLRLINHDVVDVVDGLRCETFGRLSEEHRSRMGQFGTPGPVSRLMASMFEIEGPEIRLLDAGAGVGSLVAAFVDEASRRPAPPRVIHTTAFEVDPVLAEALELALQTCAQHCDEHGIRFTYEVVEEDFIEYAVRAETDLFSTSDRKRFNCAIQNPPYRKIRSDSTHRHLLRDLGIEVSNLYAAFVGLTMRLLEPGGELVAITPRSFCNGPYFKAFRRDFLMRASLRRIHVFDSRTEAFGGDGVLQENIIVHSVAGVPSPETVQVTTSTGGPGGDETSRTVAHENIVTGGSTVPFIHLITDEDSESVAKRMQCFRSSLTDVGIDVSTGRVVDFRATEFLRETPREADAPLIYPAHLRRSGMRWPVDASTKPNAITVGPGSENLLVPPGLYVLVKRFSAKEQRRRIEAAIYDSAQVKPGSPVGFENHLNYFHDDGGGLIEELAVGLCIYLNSTLVDLYFRLFSGHTQVNATDLRNLPYPTRQALIALGRLVRTAILSQDETDALFNEELLDMAKAKGTADPVASLKKVREARDVLKQLGFPKAQWGVRSALVLLALLDLKRTSPWRRASSQRLGITEMMDYFDRHYGKKYAPNTRETVRRQTIHQFIDAGLVIQNRDDPTRAINSKDNVYEVTPEAIDMLRTFGTAAWKGRKEAYLAQAGTLREKYAQPREMARTPVTINQDEMIDLSPGGQNVLVEKIIHEFLPRFAPGATLIYVGDTEKKWAYFDQTVFENLGIEFDSHGKFPDLVVHYREKGWLLLIEAVTSHGPVDAKRHSELQNLFRDAKAGLVFVTTFLTRKDFGKFLDGISWESEVWVADSPGHMVHFDGKRFLGPYPA